MKAWAICGGANNQLATPEVAEQLAQRGIAFIPDFLSSSGAVIGGVCNRVMACDPEPFLSGVEGTTSLLLRQAKESGRTTTAIAQEIARTRIAERAGNR
jgi:leucine dehydrogenase